MNIFFLDRNPVKAAKMMCNRHVIKMCSETANLLLWPFKSNAFELPHNKQGEETKLSHKNHPCAVWARENEANFDWLLKHFLALLAEYKKRYNRTHFAQVYADFILKEYPKNEIRCKLSPFPRCFGGWKTALDKTIKDTVLAYRAYYKLAKKDFARWPSVKQIPQWFKDFHGRNFVDPSFIDGKYSKRKA